MRVVAKNYEQTHTHTHSQDNYYNPRCACTLRVNKHSKGLMNLTCLYNRLPQSFTVILSYTQIYSIYSYILRYTHTYSDILIHTQIYSYILRYTHTYSDKLRYTHTSIGQYTVYTVIPRYHYSYRLTSACVTVS